MSIMKARYYPLVLILGDEEVGDEVSQPVRYGEGHTTELAAHQEGLAIEDENITYTNRIEEVWEWA